MEAFFWVIVGALLSFVASVIANYFDVSITKFVDSRRFYASEKRRQKAMTEFKRIRNFKEGRWDIHLFAIRQGIVGFIALILSATNIIRSMLVPILKHSDPTPLRESFLGEEAMTTLLTSVPAFIALIFLFWAQFSLLRLLRTVRRFENFERYKNDLIQKWGSVDPPQVH
jgi:hypothetical protein